MTSKCATPVIRIPVEVHESTAYVECLIVVYHMYILGKYKSHLKGYTKG